MQFIIVLLLVAGIVAGGFWLRDRMTGESGSLHALLSEASPRTQQGETPTEADTRRLQEQQDLIEQRNDLSQDQQTAPMEREQEILEQQQRLQRERDDLTQQQLTAPYEQEIERIEAEKELIRQRQELEELKQEQGPSPVPEGIDPVDLGRRR